MHTQSMFRVLGIYNFDGILNFIQIYTDSTSILILFSVRDPKQESTKNYIEVILDNRQPLHGPDRVYKHEKHFKGI